MTRGRCPGGVVGGGADGVWGRVGAGARGWEGWRGGCGRSGVGRMVGGGVEGAEGGGGWCRERKRGWNGKNGGEEWGCVWSGRVNRGGSSGVGRLWNWTGLDIW
ncbi:hypothetical protein B1218_34385 [Pseudomonas ogarae]|nr:hypothetical protein B1218_34385 [Pseudomonas ogarae]